MTKKRKQDKPDPLAGYPEIMQNKHLAEIFAVDDRTVSRWTLLGKVPHFRTPGGHSRFRKADIRPFLEGGATNADA